MFAPKKSILFGSAAVLAVAAMAFGTLLSAETPNGLRAYSGGPVGVMTDQLPSVPKLPMTVTPNAVTGTSVLSFDDGSCESGLGVGTAFATDLIDFDVPTQCNQSGLAITAVTARVNSGTTFSTLAFAQAGATPPPVTGMSLVPLTSGITVLGACPATGMIQRSVAGSAVITGTSNFFAGVRGAGFVGRDTNGSSAGRMWLLCATCGNTQYSPTTLVGLGLGGNWMIRVTVEDNNCLPVELMDFSVT